MGVNFRMLDNQMDGQLFWIYIFMMEGYKPSY